MEFLLHIAPLLNAVAAITLALITWKYVVLTKALLKSNQALVESEINPQVIISIHARDGRLIISMQNVGRSQAINVHAHIEPNLDERLFHPQISTDTVTKMLMQDHVAPTQRIETVIGYMRDILSQRDLPDIRRKYNVAISYSSLERTFKKQESYDIDLSGALIPKKARSETIEFKLDKINKSLLSINDAIRTTKTDQAL